MIVEDPESLKAWMTTVLEPMCDADPEALAKYVYALVKKDKSIEFLRQSMISQLEVFLQKETVNFVDLLFRKLENQSPASVLTEVKSLKEESAPGEISQPTSRPSSPLPDTVAAVTGSIPSPSVDTDLGEGAIVGVGTAEIDLSGNVISTQQKSMEHDKEMAATLSLTSCIGQNLNQTSTSFNSSHERLNSSITSLDKLNSSGSSTSLERNSSFSSQASKDQAVYTIASTLSPEQRNGTLGSVLLSAANKRAVESERRSSSSKSRDRKSDSEKEDRGGPIRNRHLRRRDSSLSPLRRSDRSRSRSWDRSLQRRSRSRDRDRDRSRAWRNKSPPRRYDRDRRRSWSKSPIRGRLRSHSRSPPLKTRLNRYRNRSPPLLRSRSRSPYDKNDKLSPLSGGGTPTQDSNHGDTDMRLSAVSQSIQSVVSVKDSHFASKRRCRDFDEKGYCMRGELCPFDHGTDPVVLEDVALPPNLAFPPGTNPPLPVPPGLEVQNMVPPVGATSGLPIRAPPMLPLHHQHPSQIRIPHPNPNLEYNPDAPSMEPRMWIRPPFRPQGRAMLHGALRGQLQLGVPNFALHHQRELINVPVVEGGNYMPMNSNKRTLHGDYSEVCFEGDLEAALITFSSHAEASSAYKSTEAVLNNRFIKVFWHNSEKEAKQENVPPPRPSAKDRLGGHHVPQTIELKTQNTEPVEEVEKVIITGHNITKTVYIPTALRKPDVKSVSDTTRVFNTQTQLNNTAIGAANLLRNQEILAAKDILKKKREEKRKEVQKLTLDLWKMKQGLLDKSVNQQKSLLDRLEKGNLTSEQKDSVLQTIKTLQESIDMMRKDIRKAIAMKNSGTKTGMKTVTPQVFKKTKEETQKQILDVELDIFNRQQEGKDTVDLQKRVIELKTKAHRLGLLSAGRVIRGRGGIYRGRGRNIGVFTAHSSVDHRPTKLLVSGFESDDKMEVLAHFAKYGEISDYAWDEVTPALVVNFKTRKEAETAMNKGRNFQDRLLCATWYSQGQQGNLRSGMVRSVLMMDDEGDNALLDEHEEEEDEELRVSNAETTEDFLLQDEEEEEEEDRTWRR